MEVVSSLVLVGVGLEISSLGVRSILLWRETGVGRRKVVEAGGLGGVGVGRVVVVGSVGGVGVVGGGGGVRVAGIK